VNDVCANSDREVAIFNQYVSSIVKNLNLNPVDAVSNQAISVDTHIEQSLFRFAERHGLKGKIISQWLELCQIKIPAVVKRTDGRYILVVKVSNSNVLLFDQLEAKTSIVSKDQFLTVWSGYGISFQVDENNGNLAGSGD
jgi:ABC-type bacteriocin/lantibiotic exporter with double-glycine peptidase domain